MTISTAIVQIEEIEQLEIQIDHLAHLLEEAESTRGTPTGSSFANQAIREAKGIHTVIYQLLPAVGVIPDQFSPPMGILPDELIWASKIEAHQLQPIETHLPDRLIPLTGELPGDVITERRQLPADLSERLTIAYNQCNQLLAASGLGEAMRFNALAPWADRYEG